MNFTDLPPEILGRVFQYSGNLLNLTLTCKTLREVIESNTPLMNRITGHFMQGPLQCPMELFTRRPYIRMQVFIPQFFSQEVLNVLEFQAQSLQHLRVICSRFPCSEPFLKTPNFYMQFLENQTYQRDFFGPQDYDFEKVIRLPRLQTLELLDDNRERFLRHLDLTLNVNVVVTAGEYVESEEELDIRVQRLGAQGIFQVLGHMH